MATVQEVVPEQETVTATPPVNRVSARSYALSGSYLAAGMEKLSEGLNAIATPLAEKQAALDLANTTVTKDAQGNVTVGKPATLPILGPAGEAYDHAVAAGSLALGNNQTTADIANIRAKREGDPEGFKSDLDAYVQRIKASNPGVLGASMAQNAAREGTQYYAGMVQKKAEVDIANAKTAINDSMTSKENTLAALAQQGGTDTPEFKQARAEYGALSDHLVANPAFGISKDVQDANNKAFDNKMLGYAVTGHVDRDMQGPGGVLEAQKNLHDAVNDPNLNLTQAERHQMQAQGEARIVFNTGQNVVQVQANRANLEALDQAVKNPATSAKLSEPIWQAAIAKSQSLGDVESTMKLEATHQMWQFQHAGNGLSPNQSLSAQGLGPTPQGVSGYGLINAPYRAPLDQKGEGGIVSPAEHYQYLISQGASKNEALMLTGAAGSESSFNANAVHDSGNGHGLYGHNDQRLDMQGKSWQQQASAALAELRSRPEGASVNAATTPEQLALAEMHYERPRGYTSANPLGGDNYTGRLNTLRYFSQMNNGSFSGVEGAPAAGRAPPDVAGVGAGPSRAPSAASVNGIPYSDAERAANPFLDSAYVRSIVEDPANRISYAEKLGTAILQNARNGFMPSVDDAANYYQLASTEPQLAEQAAHVRATVEGYTKADAAINLPPGQGQAYIGAVMQRAQGGSIYQAEVATQAKDFYEKSVKALKDDPWGTAVAKGWAPKQPDPLNFNDPTALAVAFHQRSDIATAIATRTGDMSIAAADKSDVEQIKSIITNGSAAQVAALRQSIATLPEARQKATLAAIGQTGTEGRVFAISGALQREAPGVAADIATGQALMKDKDEFAPKASATNAELAKYMPQGNFDPAAREAIGSAATALYAKMSADAGDTTANEMKTSRFKDAVNAVTGGIVSNRGQSLVAPWYGASQANFNDAISKVTADDLKGSVTKEGTPLPASLLQSSWMSNGFKLENNGIGDGKYRIYSGPPNAKAYIKGQDGQPFLLDLGSKRAAIDATAAAPPSGRKWWSSDQSAP